MLRDPCRVRVSAPRDGPNQGLRGGAGLGDRFLRHVERTKLILHLVDVSSSSGRDAVEDYRIINQELANYNEDLAQRPQIVVATKIDALDDPERLESPKAEARRDGKPFFAISSVANQGVKELVNEVSRAIVSEPEAEEATAETVAVDGD